MWWLVLLEVLLLLASCYFSIRLLLYVHSNFRVYFSDGTRFGRVAKPLGTLLAESVIYAGSATALLAFGAWVLPEVWYEVLCYIPYGMYLASVLVWVVLPFMPLIRRQTKRRKKAQEDAKRRARAGQ